MTASGAQGTIIVYGCPAEEIMSGKIVMNAAGVFDELDVGVMWHPFDRNRISNDIWQSQDIKNYTFHGISAHASKSPEKWTEQHWDAAGTDEYRSQLSARACL